MHKKIIAAMGMAGFIMLSYVKVNYAMDYEVTEAIAEVAVQYAEETAEAKLIQKDTDKVMAAYELEDTEPAGYEYETEIQEPETMMLTEAFTEPVTDAMEVKTLSFVESRTSENIRAITQETATEKVTEVHKEDATKPVEEKEAPTAESVKQSSSQENTAYLENLKLSSYDAATAVSARVISISQKDYDILLRIVEAEATGKDVLAKMLVANVIFNRIESPSFPDTVEAVVFQKNEQRSQFSPLDDGRYYTVSITDATVEAVNRVLAGEDYSMGALYFATTKVVDSTGCWASRHFDELYRYGGHVFFKP